jgi:hypothetical protein
VTPIQLDERIAILHRADYERLRDALECVRGKVGYEEYVTLREQYRELAAELRRMKEGEG